MSNYQSALGDNEQPLRRALVTARARQLKATAISSFDCNLRPALDAGFHACPDPSDLATVGLWCVVCVGGGTGVARLEKTPLVLR